VNFAARPFFFKSLDILGPLLRKGISVQFRSQRADCLEKHKKAHKAFCIKKLAGGGKRRDTRDCWFCEFFCHRAEYKNLAGEWQAEYSCPWKAASEKRGRIRASRSQEEQPRAQRVIMITIFSSWKLGASAHYF
jgi:hypothetical protein